MRAKLSLPRVKGLGVTVVTVLGLVLGGAGVAAVTATSAVNPPMAASHAAVHHATLDNIVVYGPVSSFTTEDGCLALGNLEYDGLPYAGGIVIGVFCDPGEAVPPRTGEAWDLFLSVEYGNTCSNATPGVKGIGPDGVVCG